MKFCEIKFHRAIYYSVKGDVLKSLDKPQKSNATIILNERTKSFKYTTSV